MSSSLPGFDLRADLELLRDAALAAGAVLSAAFRGPFRRWTKDDGSPVSEVDLAVDSLLLERLIGARDTYGWLSEESADDPDRLARERVFVVDPLDGTSSFIKGSDDFCTAIALVEHGRPIAGVVFNPIRDVLFEGAVGLGAWLNGEAISPTTAREVEGICLAGTPSDYAPSTSPILWPGMRIEKSGPFAYRGAMAASGRYDAMISFGDKREWDAAAPTAVALAAGAVATDTAGRPLRFNSRERTVPGVVIAGPALHPLLIQRVAVMPRAAKSEGPHES